MGTTSHVGTADPDPVQPTITRPVHGDGRPSAPIPRSRDIRAGIPRRDTGPQEPPAPPRPALGVGPPVSAPARTIRVRPRRTRHLTAGCRRPG
ncbi:hypothetical protein GCM10011608_12020 [Micromonospora sonchi]|uniref:Uncharacterized protein n=1 Tax=Micromonospora sonchi TaxID=1763543 RepID=A0A917TME6_9ACTN|nr:hypothetical protein GCM10011608_12020 [Micromonospora sonchi]